MNYIIEARKLRPIIETAVQSLSDDVAVQSAILYPTWAAAIKYEVAYRVLYKDTLYRCLTVHISQEGWTPDVSPSLWAKVLVVDDTVLPWEQPESTNPYMKGDEVVHNDKTWISDIDNNVWEPGVYGWTEK